MSGWWAMLILCLIGFACRMAWRIGRGDHDRTTATAYRDGFVHGVRMMRNSEQQIKIDPAQINIDSEVIAAVLEREGWTIVRTPVKEAIRVPH